MYGSQQPFVRVGIRAAIVAAIVGLLVLAFSRGAVANEVGDLAERLRSRDPVTGADATRLANEILDARRNAKLLDLYDRALETGWSAATGGSPRRLLRNARDISLDIWRFGERSEDEDRALEWLRAGIDHGATDLATHELYSHLRDREIAALAEAKLEAARDSIEAGRTELGRVQLRRALELDPTSQRALALWHSLSTAPTSADPPRDEDDLDVATRVSSDTELAVAMLVGDYRSASRLAGDDADGELVRASALYLSGDVEGAVDRFDALGARDDHIGELARDFTSRDAFDLASELAREESSYKWRQMLGWFGGERLSLEGGEISTSSFRAWKDSVNPLNFALSLPARMYRGWKPDGDELAGAAARYLAAFPDGDRAGDARAWLQSLDHARSGADDGWIDDRFVLPAARTPYARLSPSSILLTRSVIESDDITPVDDLHAALGLGDSVLLVARSSDEKGLGLSEREAVRLLRDLEFAVVHSDLAPVDGGRDALLEGLHRAAEAIRGGAVLVPEPGHVEKIEMMATFTRAVVDGQDARAGALVLARGADDFTAQRSFGRAPISCPDGMLCVDRGGHLQGVVYAQVDTESDVVFGLQTNLSSAHVNLAVHNDLPRLNVSLPIARWLGVDRWIPLAAQISVSPDAVYVGPRLER